MVGVASGTWWELCVGLGAVRRGAASDNGDGLASLEGGGLKGVGLGSASMQANAPIATPAAAAVARADLSLMKSIIGVAGFSRVVAREVAL